MFLADEQSAVLSTTFGVASECPKVVSDGTSQVGGRCGRGLPSRRGVWAVSPGKF